MKFSCKKHCIGYADSRINGLKFSEECGIFGGVSHTENIAPFIQQGLVMLQHRGQESAGICCGDNYLFVNKGRGLVTEVFSNNVIKTIKGKTGIGHVRYSTQGVSDSINAQPFLINHLGQKIAIAHNGNVNEALEIKNSLEEQGEEFLTSSDTEILLKKVVKELYKPPKDWSFQEIGDVLTKNFFGGAWSVLFCIPEKIFAYRDPLGYRPLVLCEAEEGVFVSSEDTAFQILTVKKTIHIKPGEGVIITKNGYEIKRFAEEIPSRMCIFEQIYFAHPNSNIFGKNVYMTRVELGKKCALENPVNADIVVPIMDSGLAQAIGFSQQSGIPFQMGLVKNNEIGRTFILPESQMRQNGVISKFTAIRDVLEDKRVVIVDDSIVRGTTSREAIRMIRDAGAKEIHFRSASPELINICQWGVDIPSKEELIANNYKNIDEIKNSIGADTLKYLSIEGLKEVFGEKNWCYSCLTSSNINKSEEICKNNYRELILTK